MTGLVEPRRAAAVGLVAALLVVAALAVAGLRSTEMRTFALRVPDSQVGVGVAGPGHPVCEGPVRSGRGFDGVAVYGNYVAGAPVIGVRVRSRSGRLLAGGTRASINRLPEQRIALDRRIPGTQPVEVCVVAQYGRFALRGATGVVPGVRTHGVRPGRLFSLLLTRPSTLLGSLGTVFSRAAVFRPDWVGAWTFWILLGLLVASIALLVSAAAAATADDGPPEPGDPYDADGTFRAPDPDP